MGRIKHNALIVTSTKYSEIKSIRDKAIEIYQLNFAKDPTVSSPTQHITDICEGLANDLYTFLIAPDGSKEGWSISDTSDKSRKEVISYITENNIFCDYIEVYFGGDDDIEFIVESNNKP